ncbi:MAG: rod shape-determining protein MreC [Phycisphaerales bacterium]
MRRKKINLSRGMLFTWGTLLGLIFLFAVPQQACSRLQLTYASVFRWPLAWGRSATLAARSPVSMSGVASREYEELLSNHRQLQNKMANLQAALQDVQRRNEQLAKLREKPGWENIELRQARILTMADATQTQLFINRGSEDNVANGQFAVNLSDRGDAEESSVIGTVSDVAAGTAKIRLITDKDSRVFVSIANLTARGTMTGQGDGTARISMIQREHKVSKGDPVYTEKQPGLDVPVITARVVSTQVDRDNPFFWDIRVEPVCDVAALSEVAVVVSTPRPQ